MLFDLANSNGWHFMTLVAGFTTRRVIWTTAVEARFLSPQCKYHAILAPVVLVILIFCLFNVVPDLVYVVVL